jgi:hypothetical protein
MARFFKYEVHFFSHKLSNRALRPLHYIGDAFKTVRLLTKNRPEVFWIQLPPSPLLTITLLYRRICDPRMKIVADCHNSTFDLPWRKWPGMAKQLNAVNAVLVHNSAVLSKAIALGIHQSKIHVIEDPPAALRHAEGKDINVSYPRPWLLFMTSFGADEPIAEVLAAAVLLPEITIVIAGDRRRAQGRHRLRPHPPNVIFAGYLSGFVLDATIKEADAILALTKNADEQLSAAAEAVGGGKAMVLADTPVLREMYPTGVVYASVDEASSIASGCRAAVARRDILEKESIRLRVERQLKWSRGASALAEALNIRK